MTRDEFWALIGPKIEAGILEECILDEVRRKGPPTGKPLEAEAERLLSSITSGVDEGRTSTNPDPSAKRGEDGGVGR